LAAWTRYAAAAGRMTYYDSVVGMFHVVDLQLPADAFAAAFGVPDEASAAAMEQRYLEPLAALQDDDLDFPGSTLLGYYAVYNAFMKYARHADIDDGLILSQALSGSGPESEWLPMLAAAVREAEEVIVGMSAPG
jgi:hypothetical protein